MSNSDLKKFIDRIETLTDEKDAIAESITEVYAEAEAAGFEKEIVRMAVKVRKDKEKFQQNLLKLDTYMSNIDDQLGFNFEWAQAA